MKAYVQKKSKLVKKFPKYLNKKWQQPCLHCIPVSIYLFTNKISLATSFDRIMFRKTPENATSVLVDQSRFPAKELAGSSSQSFARSFSTCRREFTTSKLFVCLLAFGIGFVIHQECCRKIK